MQPKESSLKATFEPTQEMIDAAQAVFVAKALVATISPVVLNYQRRILQEGQWPIAEKYVKRLGAGTITEPERSYLMSDEDFAVYDARCKAKRIAAGLYVEDPDKCPMLVAQSTQSLAERALADAMRPITKGMHEGLVNGRLENYRKFIELTLHMLAPYCQKALGTSVGTAMLFDFRKVGGLTPELLGNKLTPWEVDQALQVAATACNYYQTLRETWDHWHYGKHAEIAQQNLMPEMAHLFKMAWAMTGEVFTEEVGIAQEKARDNVKARFVNHTGMRDAI